MRTLARFRLWTAALSLCGIAAFAASHAQPADFALERLPPPEGTSAPAGGVEATVRLYSDGHNLTLFAEVIDPDVRRGTPPALGDRLELWFALPRSAFPEDFVFEQHPAYVVAPPGPSRGGRDRQARLFFPSPKVPKGAGLPGFLRLYPQADTILADSLLLPMPARLQAAEVHLGLVGIALFPDGRPAQLLNGPALRQTSEWLNIPLQPAVSSLRYTAEPREDRRGYIINAEISPRTLGFITLPELRQLRFAVHVFDLPPTGGPARLVRTTTPQARPHQPATFTPLTLRQPLYLDFIGVTDSLLYLADLQPLCVYGENGWLPIHLDIDALVYRPFWSSEHLLELRCTPLEWTHRWDTLGPYRLERLVLGQVFVNELPRETTFLRFRNQLVPSRQSAYVLPEPGNLSPSLFRFPDGRPGLIQYESRAHHPYGWGSCGTCLHEDLHILRLGKSGPQTLVEISQWDGPDAYCQIGELRFEGYYLSRYDWIREGQMLVCLLAHRIRPRQLRRVKVSWDAQGQQVEVVAVD